MIVVGEIAVLAKEIEWKEQGILLQIPSADSGDRQTVTSTNRDTIQAQISKFGGQDEGTSQQRALPNPAEAARSFVLGWTTGDTGPGQTSSANADQQSESTQSKSEALQRRPDDEDFRASEQVTIAELLDEWEGSEERLLRKKVCG